ncbi:P-loop ATPase, Sll1717 family [Tundrisphaera sp. TA3]|uniref:P-loop ATPase, Sll1717 family n=1 Tax=Tundrisphaera sp. TA3 TaxID=3435775 RepID=UPI003EBEE89C
MARHALDHGDSFWKDPDERVKETTKKTETQLKGGLKKIPGLDLDLEASKKWTSEQKAEVRAVGQEIVSSVKLKDLNKMFDLLVKELNDDTGYAYFIVIDDLDQGWAEDAIRYKLIYALIETIREFQRIDNVKIVICLRTDLVERVLKQIKGPGYQEEKIKSLFLDLTWTPEQLAELVDARINQLVRDSFTVATITHKDILPSMGKKSQQDAALQYMIDRTLKRPRDLISFFNFCIKKSYDKPQITKSTLLAAEIDYSNDRRRSLEQEWQADYPDLSDYIDMFKKMPAHFRLGTMNSDKLLNFAVKHSGKYPQPEGKLGILAQKYINADIQEDSFRQSMAWILYGIGFLGIKADTYTSMKYVGNDDSSINKDDITDESLCMVHRMYWMALGIHDQKH